MAEDRQWIIGGEDCPLDRTVEGLKVGAKGQLASYYLGKCRINVRAHSYPLHSRLCGHVWKRLTLHQQPEEIGKIHTGPAAQSVPTPNTRINVQELILAVA